MKTQTRILLGFLVLPLVVLVAFLKFQNRQGLVEQRQRWRETERISNMREDPMGHVHSGMTVTEVNQALGPGERFRAKGQEMIVWTGAGREGPWTLTAVVKNGKISDVSMLRGTGDKRMAMQLEGAFEEPRPDESETLANFQGEDQERIVAMINALGGTVRVDETSPDKPVIHVRFGRNVWGGQVVTRPYTDRTPQFTGPALARLKGLTHLQSLSLVGTEVTDAGLAYVKELTGLTSLHLSHTKISDAGLEHLKGLEKLSQLSLDKTHVAGPGLVHLKGLASLRQLALSGEKFSDAGLQHLGALTGLEKLTLSGPQITDDGLQHLAALKNLQELNLSCENMRGNGLAHLAELPNLENLNLRGTCLTDAGAVGLQRMTRLKSLCLSNANDRFAAMFLGGNEEPVTIKVRITDVGMQHLAGLANLRSLDLGGTLITEAGLVHLERLTNLERLNLEHTQVRETGLVHLKGLTNLKHLSLDSTQIRDAGLEYLEGLKSLEMLSITDSQVTDEGRRKLKQALPNCLIF